MLLIREMLPQDIDDLLSGFTAQGWEKPRADLENYYRHMQEAIALPFIAQMDGKAVGYCVLYPHTILGPFKGEPEISDFNVFIPYRCRGIGSAILDAAENAAKAYSNIVTLGVGLHAGYGPAQRMYIKRGYIPDGSGVWYMDKPLAPNAPCVNDDDLVLYLSKTLGK